MFTSETHTPFNVDQMSLEEVSEHIITEDTSIGKKTRLKIIKNLYDLLGFSLSPDIALSLASNPRVKTIVATAGSGKTTMVQVDIIAQKLFHQKIHKTPLYGNRVLCLVYNDHNVAPMEATHRRLVARLRIKSGVDLGIDDKINASTLHKFCNTWISEYLGLLGIPNAELQEEYQALTLLEDCFKLISKKFNFLNLPSFSNVFKGYSFAKECLLEFDDPEVLSVMEIDEEFHPAIKQWLAFYENFKSRKKKYDYVDMLSLFHKLVTEHPAVAERIRANYEVVVSDEAQDNTLLMQSVIALIVHDKKHIRVGDEDQTLYSFKGAKIQNFLDYKKFYPDSYCFLLNINRRCPKLIVDAAASVVQKNKLRFNKKLLASKEGGEVKLVGYSSEEGQIVSIVNQLKSLTYEEISDTLVLYRDRRYSILLTEKLAEAGVPFHVISGHMPFAHELYTHVMDILDLMCNPYDQTLQLRLYKYLPSIKRKELEEIVGYDSKNKSFKNSVEPKHFADLDFGRYLNTNKFFGTVQSLKILASEISTAPMKDYMGFVFKILRDYYWDYRMKMNASQAKGSLDAIYTEKVANYFNSNFTYVEFFRKHVETLESLRRTNDAKSGVAVSTFHGSKGLEYSKVYMTYMDGNIFPSIDPKAAKLSEAEKLDLEEAETRACYVAMTRSKSSLYMYYNIDSPSPYIETVQEFLSSVAKTETPKEDAQKISEMQSFTPSVKAPTRGGIFSRF